MLQQLLCKAGKTAKKNSQINLDGFLTLCLYVYFFTSVVVDMFFNNLTLTVAMVILNFLLFLISLVYSRQMKNPKRYHIIWVVGVCVRET